jgi:hypothetical protein
LSRTKILCLLELDLSLVELRKVNQSMFNSLEASVLMKKTGPKGNGLKNGDGNRGWNRNGLNTGEGIRGLKVKSGDVTNGLNTNGLKNPGKKKG